MEYGGGTLMDWIGHHNDIAHWALGLDKAGPVKVEAQNFRYPEKGRIFDSPIDYTVRSEYERHNDRDLEQGWSRRAVFRRGRLGVHGPPSV